MKVLAELVRVIDHLNDTIGRVVAWLTLAMVLVTFSVVVFRYVFSLGWVWMQESYVWLHGIIFMLGAGYTLLHNGHVRVDIFYRPKSDEKKAWVDLLGVIFLLHPVITFAFLGRIVNEKYIAKTYDSCECVVIGCHQPGCVDRPRL